MSVKTQNTVESLNKCRGELIGTMLDMLPPQMADKLYNEFADKLREYIIFQDGAFCLSADEDDDELGKKRKYMYYKFTE